MQTIDKNNNFLSFKKFLKFTIIYLGKGVFKDIVEYHRSTKDNFVNQIDREKHIFAIFEGK